MYAFEELSTHVVCILGLLIHSLGIQKHSRRRTSSAFVIRILNEISCKKLMFQEQQFIRQQSQDGRCTDKRVLILSTSNFYSIVSFIIFISFSYILFVPVNLRPRLLLGANLWLSTINCTLLPGLGSNQDYVKHFLCFFIILIFE